MPLEEFSLYVYPNSHRLMRSMMEEHGPNFSINSTSAIDAEIAANTSVRMPLRLVVQPGELIIFDGYLVHAGSEGKSGASRLRLHLYLQSSEKEVSVMVGKEIHSYPMQRLHENVVSTELACKFAQVI